MKLSERRAFFRKGLSNLYIPDYDALCAELPEEWQPCQGLRTFNEQTKLFLQGRQGNPGPVVTKARAGESAHNYGCGTDWVYWLDDQRPCWLPHSDSRWDVYRQAIEKVGLKWGGDFGDWPHNELALNCDWKHVLIVFNQNGMIAAQDKIKEAMK